MKFIILSIFLISTVISVTLAAPHESEYISSTQNSKYNDSSNSNEINSDSNLSEEEKTKQPNFQSLQEWIDEYGRNLKSKPSNHSLSKFWNKIDLICVNEKLKIDENGNKNISRIQASVSIGIAQFKCYDKSEKTGITFVINDLINEFAKIDLDYDTDCLLYELKKLEPNSKLVENFDAEQMKNAEKKCRESFDVFYLDLILEGLGESVGGMAKFTCGSLKTKDLKNWLFKSVVLSVEKNKELKESETEKLVEAIATKLDGTFECVVENF